MKDFLEYIARRILRDKDFLLVPVMIVGVVASSFAFLSGKTANPDNERELVLLTGMLVVVMAVLMIRYLSGSSKIFSPDSRERMVVFELSRRVKELQLQRDVLTKENRSELLS